MNNMSNEKAREMAFNMVGDGLLPNKYFVTRGPWCYVNPGDEEMSTIPGFDVLGHEPIGIVTKVFDSLEDAENEFHEIDLSFDGGIGCVMIEDRSTGIIRDKRLRATVSYEVEGDSYY
jgi:hypothetical protein